MTTLLNVKDLRAYYGQVQALHGLNFSLNEGSLTTLLGANGAGKTTTLRAICNMVRSTGAIEFEGTPLSSRSTESIVRLGIAHVPQGRGTFTTMTVEENLQLGAITRRDKAGIVPAHAERQIDVGLASAGERGILAVTAAQPVYRIEKIVTDREGRPLALSQLVTPSHLVTYTIKT